MLKFYRYPGEWELNVGVSKWCVRIGNYQVALWRNYDAIFSFCRQRTADGS